MKKLICLFFLILMTFSSSCAAFNDAASDNTTDWPLASVKPETTFTTASFTVTAPAGTPDNAELGLVIFDEVTGAPYNSHTLGMESVGNGEWTLELSLPAGTLLRYRYVRISPSYAEETTASREAVSFRLAYLPASTVVQDIIAGWTDHGFQGETGRIIGRVYDADTGLPVTEALVGAAGEHTFTDAMGGFQFDYIAPGLQNLVITSVDGSYITAQQGAVVAENSLTPAEMTLTPAQETQVTFEVTLPEDTPPEMPVRIAGSLAVFGQTFYPLEGGTSTSAVRMPQLVRIDASHAILIADLYEGTDLHYKYSLGDGLWNAERNADGFFHLRQALITPGLILRDTVETWHGEQKGSIYFMASPGNPLQPGSTLTLQLNPFTWFYPLPMVELENNDWMFILMNPLDFTSPVSYRYCLDHVCANPASPSAELLTGSTEFQPRDSSQLFEDSIESWGWPTPEPVDPIAMPDIIPRPSFEKGFELLPLNNPAWPASIESFTAAASSMNANAVTLTPAWTADRAQPMPSMLFNPANSPFYQDLASAAGSIAGNDINVNIKPILISESGLDLWWQEAPRDYSWWNIWFERYSSMVLAYAHLAEETGARRFILGGPEVVPALPDGTLADGSSSQPPADAESRWNDLITEVRSIYSGTIAFEIVYNGTISPPPFLEAVDEIFIHWSAPLADTADTKPAVLQQNAVSLTDAMLDQLSGFESMPLIVSFSFPSVDGGSTSCITGEQSACIQADAFNSGTEIPGSPQADPAEQMQAVHAVMLALYRFEDIDGAYLNRTNPCTALPDKSASIMGKPAEELVSAWFTGLD